MFTQFTFGQTVDLDFREYADTLNLKDFIEEVVYDKINFSESSIDSITNKITTP